MSQDRSKKHQISDLALRVESTASNESSNGTTRKELSSLVIIKSQVWIDSEKVKLYKLPRSSKEVFSTESESKYEKYKGAYFGSLVFALWNKAADDSRNFEPLLRLVEQTRAENSVVLSYLHWLA